MRVVLLPIALRPRNLFLGAALALTACGGSDDGGAATPARTDRPAETASSAPKVTTPAAAKPGTSGVEAAKPKVPGASSSKGAMASEPAVDGPLTPTFPVEKPAPTAPAMDGLPKADPVLGPPLVINGKVIPFDRVRREICLGGFGVPELELAKVRIYIDAEIKRRRAAGASAEATSVSAEELDTTLAEIQQRVQEDFPDEGYGLDEIMGGIGGGDPRERLRTMRLFNKLFLPDDPSEFPPMTLQAMEAQAAGKEILEHYQMWWDMNKENPQRRKGVAERTFDETILSQVLSLLHESAQVVEDPAPGVLVRVDGVDIPVADIWESLQPVSPQEVRRAKLWIANTTLLRERLQGEGKWLTEAEAEAAYHEHSDPYAGQLFSRENIAMMIKHFPSVDRYKEYYRIYESFHRFKQPEMTQAVLDAHAQNRTAMIVGLVAVDADIILCSAFDFRMNRWKEDGWDGAEKRMRDVLRLLVEEQRPWEEMVERYSEFVEPPIPVSERDKAQPTSRKGRFRNVQRNNMLGLLGETEYDLFLNGGESITDFLFFEQEIGTLGDPMRGPNGWYLPRLIRRAKAPQRIPMKPEDYQEVVLEDYLTTELNAFARQLIQQGEVYGLDS